MVDSIKHTLDHHSIKYATPLFIPVHVGFCNDFVVNYLFYLLQLKWICISHGLFCIAIIGEDHLHVTQWCVRQFGALAVRKIIILDAGEEERDCKVPRAIGTNLVPVT